MDDNQFSQFTPYSKKPSSPKVRAFVYVIIFVVLVAGAMIIGNVFLSQRNAEEEGSITPTPEVEMTPTPTPEMITPTPEEDSVTPTSTQKVTPTPTGKAAVTPTQAAKKGISVRVLNGSGEQGAAGDGAAVLLAAGYTITGTGNADTFDYDETVIQVKKSKQTEAAALRKALSTEYTVAQTVETLAETANVDAIVIVGTK
ncbi:MAG: LytR protein [Patescibacteria group bacterium]|jgi:hypothetical protein|nr:LytR protein [Patescibacteria group bacterium]